MVDKPPNISAQCRNIRHKIPAANAGEVAYISGLMVEGQIGVGTKVLMSCLIGTELDPRIRVLQEDRAKFKPVTKLPEVIWTELTRVLKASPQRHDLAIALAALHVPALEMALEGGKQTPGEFRTM
eukprot:5963754-Amphidinium_carterae.1